LEKKLMAGVVAVPGSTLSVSFSTKNASTLELTNASAVAVVIKDPGNVIRVLYVAGNLTNIATGKYTYYFTIPDDVVEGDWHVNISVTVAGVDSVRNAHFPVKEV